MALRRVAIASPNYSSRGGAGVRLVVCHTAEGARTYPDLGAYFQDDVGVSSHVGIDDTPGEIGEYVARGGSAWCQSSYNGVAVCAELCAFADWPRAEWLNNHSTMLSNLALWIGEECSAFGIPIVDVGDGARSGASGVCQHINLGAEGGGHVDCDYGSGNFPMAEVLEMARGGAPPPVPVPTPPPAGAAPPWPGVYLANYTEHPSAATWQSQMINRGWTALQAAGGADGKYGDTSERVCRQFQSDSTAHGWPLDDDGVVGPETWRATWERPIS